MILLNQTEAELHDNWFHKLENGKWLESVAMIVPGRPIPEGMTTEEAYTCLKERRPLSSGKTIPSKFILGAIEYNIKEVEFIDDHGLGICYSGVKEIRISRTHNNKNVPFLAKEQTLYHEVVHAILDEIGREDLSSDESFVQSFSLMLHQFDKTKK